MNIDSGLDKQDGNRLTCLIMLCQRTTKVSCYLPCEIARLHLERQTTMPSRGDEMDAATELLRKLLIKPEILDGQRDHLIAFSEACIFLPLAIIHAAAYINMNGTAISQYLSMLKEPGEEVIELLSEKL